MGFAHALTTSAKATWEALATANAALPGAALIELSLQLFFQSAQRLVVQVPLLEDREDRLRPEAGPE